MLKEKTKMNLKSEKNISNNKYKGNDKLTKNISSTSRTIIKDQFEITSKSISKKKSRKVLKKSTEKHSTVNFTQAIGKENRMPKNICKNYEEKRGSLPRVDKSKCLTKRQILSSKRSGRRKINKSNKSIKNIKSIKNFKQTKGKKNNRVNTTNTTNVNSNSSILGFNHSRSRLNTKRLMANNYSTSVQGDNKVLRQIDELYSVVLSMRFISDINPKTSQGEQTKLWEEESWDKLGDECKHW